MVIKKKEGVLGEGEIKPFTKKEMEAWKWPIRIFLILAISMFIGWSVYTTPGLMNSIFAKTAIDGSSVSGTGPSGGTNPPITGAATPTPTPGQEKAVFASSDWQKKLENDRTGTSQEAYRLQTWEQSGKRLYPINVLPKEILVNEQLKICVVNLQIKNGVLTGFLKNDGVEEVRVLSAAFNLFTADYSYGGAVETDSREDHPSYYYSKIKPGSQRSLKATIEKNIIFIRPAVQVDTNLIWS